MTRGFYSKCQMFFRINTRFPIQCRPFPLKELTNHGGRRIVEKKVGVGYLVLGLASGLEAFSREPPCDSIGALAVRQTPETSGMAREFLSYYPLLPSRYLRDPSTISLDDFVSRNSLSTIFVWTALPSTRSRREPKNDPHFALREYLSQFPAK